MRRPNHRPRFTDPLELLPKGLTKLNSIWVSWVYPFASKGRNVSFHFTSQCGQTKVALESASAIQSA